MRRMVVAALMTVAAFPAAAQTDDELRAALVGSWGNTLECDQSILTFTADGGFQLRNVALEEQGPPGSYTIVAGKLNGEAGDMVMPEVIVAVEGGAVYFRYPDGESDRLYPCPAQ